jgi:hypothetical protein
MKFEVIESPDEWIVCRDGVELARFGDQLQALAEVTVRLAGMAKVGGSYSLAVRYRPRA